MAGITETTAAILARLTATSAVPRGVIYTGQLLLVSRVGPIVGNVPVLTQ